MAEEDAAMPPVGRGAAEGEAAAAASRADEAAAAGAAEAEGASWGMEVEGGVGPKRASRKRLEEGPSGAVGESEGMEVEEPSDAMGPQGDSCLGV